jgi:hypothetical protein
MITMGSQPHTLYRVTVRKRNGVWICTAGKVDIPYPAWPQALQKANVIARKWRTHYSGWF